MRDSIFISYSHSDQTALAEFQKLLDSTATLLNLDIWSDKRISPASRWQEDIEEALSTSAAAVLLLSPAFFASTFIRDYELPPLLAAATAGELRIFAVVLDACDHRSITNVFQAVNDPARPLKSSDETARRETWQRLVSLLGEVATQIDDEARIGAEQLRLSHDAAQAASVAHVNDKIARAAADVALSENKQMRENTLVTLEGQRCEAISGWLMEEMNRPGLKPTRSKAIVRMMKEVALKNELVLKRATELTREFADQMMAMVAQAKKEAAETKLGEL